MKFIVLALLLPVLVTSIYNYNQYNALRSVNFFEKEFQRLLVNKDYKAVAKYIDDDFRYYSHGIALFMDNKAEFLRTLKYSDRLLFDGERVSEEFISGGNVSVVYLYDGYYKNFTLSPNAALKAGYELVQCDAGSKYPHINSGPVIHT